MKIKRFLTITFIAVLMAMTISFGTTAAVNHTVVVSPTNEEGFVGFAEAGGRVSFVNDANAPSGIGALRLTTNNTDDAYAGYTKETETPLSKIKELSYYTKQNSGPAFADASFALGVELDGKIDDTEEAFTFLIYEPYLQTASIIPGTFQFQDVDAGKIYSTRTVTCSNGTIMGAPGGFGTLYTLNEIKQICPNAVVTLFGVFIGTSNPNYDVEVDLLNFNGTIYDFEPSGTSTSTKPQTKEDCKGSRYKRFNNPKFRNQGQCIKFVNQLEKTKIKRN